MPLDQMTMRRLLQSRPDLAQLLSQGATAPTQATMPTGGFLTGGPPEDVMPAGVGAGFMPESLTRASEPADEGFGGGLWDRVKGFFDPDEDADPAQQRYDADVSSAGWAGAAQAAAAAASNSQLSPIQVLTQALAGYSGARQRAKSELRGEAREERLFGLKERELEATLSESEAKAEQRRQLMEQIRGIEDPAQLRAALLNPEAYGAQLAKQAFPEKQNLIEVNNGLFDPNSRSWVVEPQVKPTTPFGSDALGYFQIGPDGQPVQVVGGLGRAGEKPQIFGSAEGGYYTLGANGPQQLVPGIGRAGDKPQIFGSAQSGYYTLGPNGQPRELVPGKDTSETSGTLYKVRRPDGTAGYATRDQILQNPQWQPLTEESTGTQPERDRQLLLKYNQIIGADGTGFNKLTPEQQAEYRRVINEVSPPKTDPASGFTIYPELSDLYRPPPLPDIGLPGVAPGSVPPGVPLVSNVPPGTPGISGAPLPPQRLERLPPAGVAQTINTPANRTQIAKVGAARGALESAIGDYKQIVEKAGGKIIPGSPAATALDAARTRVKLRAKDVYELGALTGPDDELMGYLVPGATGLGGVGDTMGRVNAGLSQLTKDLDAQLAATQQAYGPPGARPTPAPAAPAPAAPPDDDAARSKALFGY